MSPEARQRIRPMERTFGSELTRAAAVTSPGRTRAGVETIIAQPYTVERGVRAAPAWTNSARIRQTQKDICQSFASPSSAPQGR